MGLYTAQEKRKRRCNSSDDDGDQAQAPKPCTVWSSKNLDRAKLVSSRSVRTKGEAGRVNAGETSDIKP